AFRRLQHAHAHSLSAMKTAGDFLAVLLTQAAAGKAQGAGERASELVSRVERIRSAMRASDIESPEDTARELEPAIATLVPAAVVVGVGYLALRVAAAQAELRLANQDLEHRVSERTRDLSQAMEQLKESEAQLVQTEKMSSLGQLVAGVVHEINTPLAYVKN